MSHAAQRGLKSELILTSWLLIKKQKPVKLLLALWPLSMSAYLAFELVKLGSKAIAREVREFSSSI